MILADSSVWIDHLRHGEAALADLLDGGQVLTHPLVIGEIALGSLRQRGDVLAALRDLPKGTVVEDDEVMAFIDRYALHDAGKSPA